MPSPIGSARSNGKVSPINDVGDHHGKSRPVEKEIENGNLTVTLTNDLVEKATQETEKEKSNFFTRLFKKKKDDETEKTEEDEKKKDDGPKLKIFEIVCIVIEKSFDDKIFFFSTSA